jgi:short subunit dehydrogenase-like uncharacterized protein
VLAGRNADKLKPLAARLGLPFQVVDLTDGAALEQALAEVHLVFHAAGPFVDTSAAMLRACLATGTHYVDITGEVSVFRDTFALDAEARTTGVVLMSGVGFDVVPTDCLAAYVARRLPGIVSLEIAIAGMAGVTAGTAKSILDGVGAGVLARRHGELVAQAFGKGGKRVRFSDRERSVLPIPWGDLETAYRSTGVPNITTYMAVPRGLAEGAASTWPLAAAGAPVLKLLLGQPKIRGALGKLIDSQVEGPSAQQRATGRSHVWVRGADAEGKTREAWLEVAEAYTFTARSGVLAVERILAAQARRGTQHFDAATDLRGALTPAQGFGEDFVLEVEGSRRMDAVSVG